MVIARYVCLLIFLICAPVFANEQDTQSKPIERGFGQHDACLGDKYETDDDLKTGNELSVEEILNQILSPGT